MQLSFKQPKVFSFLFNATKRDLVLIDVYIILPCPSDSAFAFRCIDKGTGVLYQHGFK